MKRKRHAKKNTSGIKFSSGLIIVTATDENVPTASLSHSSLYVYKALLPPLPRAAGVEWSCVCLEELRCTEVLSAGGLGGEEGVEWWPAVQLSFVDVGGVLESFAPGLRCRNGEVNFSLHCA